MNNKPKQSLNQEQNCTANKTSYETKWHVYIKVVKACLLKKMLAITNL